MNRIYQRGFSLLIALMLTVSSAVLGIPEAQAEEIPRTDAYVLSYDTAVENYIYGEKAYMYVSPFRMKHGYTDPVSGSKWEYTYSNEIFQLINMQKLEEGGEGAYASLPVYCTDVDTDTASGAVYRRINLEDSSYHASGAAARLRSVILSSFPYVQDMAVITEKANLWLESKGYLPIVNLQIGESMLATQQAIWKITHADHYTVIDHNTGCGTYDGSDAVYTENASETLTDHSESNIAGLYQYLLSLDGIAPMDDAVSEATFENVYYTAEKAEDGTYTVTVSCEVNTAVGEGDSLTLSALCGGQLQQMELESGGTYEFTFDNMPYRQEVLLELNGYQVGGDVYLFDAEGNRGAAQSMIGFDDSCLPVYGEVVAGPERVLNIYKTTKDGDNGKVPLENIEFRIYKVATMDQIEKGLICPSADNIDTFLAEENWIADVTTDAMGHGIYNFTQNQQPDGVYLIAESDNPATTGAVSPFYVMIPGTKDDGTGHAYTVTVNPKNISEPGPDIHKNVTGIDQFEDSYAIGDVINWILRAQIPAGIRNAKEYIISDTVDHRLTYIQGSPSVRLYTMTGEELPLDVDVHYILTEESSSETVEGIDRFSVALTPQGMEYIAHCLDTWDETAELRVYFNTVINTEAAMGEPIPNQARLDYTNATGIQYDDESEEPVVYTGGQQLLKTDSDNIPLSGAVFKIARCATEAEKSDVLVQKSNLTVDGNVLTVVYEDFYGTADLSGGKRYETKSDNNGMVWFYGLDYGTYYIVETKAPDGYNLLSEPITVEIDGSSHLEANKVTVINTKFALPETGGMGTAVFTAAGIGILSVGMLLLISERKRNA